MKDAYNHWIFFRNANEDAMEAEIEAEIAEEIAEVEKEEEESLLSSDKENRLIVYNDAYNTFDHVIETLMRLCGHHRIQAEQCTYIIHFRGKCCVKQGSYSCLKPIHKGIVDAGIQAEIV